MDKIEDFAQTILLLQLKIMQCYLHISENNKKEYKDCLEVLERLRKKVDLFSDDIHTKDFKNAYILCKRIINEVDKLYAIFEMNLSNAWELYSYNVKYSLVPHMQGMFQLADLFYGYIGKRPKLEFVLLEHKSVRDLSLVVQYLNYSNKKPPIITAALEYGGYILIPKFDYMTELSFKLNYSYDNKQYTTKDISIKDLHDGINVYYVIRSEDAKSTDVQVVSQRIMSDFIKELLKSLGGEDSLDIFSE